MIALLAVAVQASWDSEWAGTIVPETTAGGGGGVPEPIPPAKGCHVQVSFSLLVFVSRSRFSLQVVPPRPSIP